MARRVLPLLFLLPCALATACGEASVQAASGAPQCGSGPAAESASARRAVPKLNRIVVVVMENKTCRDVIGSPQAPYVNGLASRYSFASRYYALTTPSLPNYLGLTGGSTFGITNDCTDCTVHAVNLVDQLERAHISWKAYMEGMPAPCFGGSTQGRYAKKHNPFAYYVDITSKPSRCRRIVPLTQLSRDIRSRTLPRFVWITPDICHDMHSCPIRDGDRFLSRLIPSLLGAVGPRSAIFVTWDEGDGRSGCCKGAAGGDVPTIVAGPAARLRGRSGVAYDHYSLLRTIEDAWGLARLRGAACPCARPLSALLR